MDCVFADGGLWLYTLCSPGSGVRMKAICYPLAAAVHQLHKGREMWACRALNHLPGSRSHALALRRWLSGPRCSIFSIIEPQGARRALKCAGKHTPGNHSAHPKANSGVKSNGKSLPTHQARSGGLVWAGLSAFQWNGDEYREAEESWLAQQYIRLAQSDELRQRRPSKPESFGRPTWPDGCGQAEGRRQILQILVKKCAPKCETQIKLKANE